MRIKDCEYKKIPRWASITQKEETFFDLDKLKANFKTYVHPKGCDYVFIDDFDGWITFLLVTVGDGGDEAQRVYQTEGPGGINNSLKEPRHTNWGVDCDGYMFNIDTDVLTWSFNKLHIYFD